MCLEQGLPTAGARYLYSEGTGPPRKGLQNLGARGGHFEQKPGRLPHSLSHAAQGNKDYNPMRQGIAAYGDASGYFSLLRSGEVHRSLLTLLLPAGVSSSPASTMVISGLRVLSHT